MAEGRENDKNTGGNSTHGNVNGLDMNELNLGLANEESSLHNMVNAYTQEYENLEHTLDEIDVWMDKIEEQNDSLNVQLDDLLQSSKETRKALQEENMKALMESEEETPEDNQTKDNLEAEESPNTTTDSKQ